MNVTDKHKIGVSEYTLLSRLAIYIVALAWVILGIYIYDATQDEGITLTTIKYFLSLEQSGVKFRALILLAPIILTIISYLISERAELFKKIFLLNENLEKEVERRTRQLLEAQKNLKEKLAELSQLDSTLRESEERFRKIFEEGPLGMAVVGMDGGFIKINATLCRMVGYTENELMLFKFTDISHPEDVVADLQYVQRLLGDEIPYYKSEKRCVKKGGTFVWTSCTASIIRDEAGKPLYFLEMMEDIAERKILDEKLKQAAYYDSLTNLPNRASFLSQLKAAIANANRQKDYMFAVLFFDLDRFKNINDSLGHMIGDQLLVEVAERMRECLRPYDMVARFGGDEFGILLTNIKNVWDVVHATERLHNRLKVPVKIYGHEVYTTASIGITMGKIEYERPEDILRDADTAMYKAKALGRDCYVIFDDTMHAQAASHLQMENNLRRAIEREEFLLHYQPIVLSEKNEIVGFEALLRWNHPEKGLIFPHEFISVAEETGLITTIGQWIVHEACRQMHSWHEQFPEKRSLTISVNISIKQFTPKLVTTIEQALLETGMNPSRLQLEITESVIMKNPELAAEVFSQLKKLDIKVEMDDFGTGYSSLGYLHQFSFDALKIDQSFVQAMCDNEWAMEIVKTIVSMAHYMKMKVIAEGVETFEQVEELRKLKCEYFQGYWFSRPLDKNMAEALLQNTH
ncbi:MAG: putative bifunctional diguanylate cyclase/phosphodiesterase [Dissulfurispiraceae bacterium]